MLVVENRGELVIKKCKACLIDFDISNFWKKSASKDGYDNMCRKCRQAYQKKYHAKAMRNYRRTLKGFMDQKYTTMSKRVRGKDRNCKNTATGLPIISRKVFYQWAEKQENLKPRFEKYKQENFEFKWCPTIDRINPKEGYIIGNIQFLYQSENAQKHTDDWSKNENNS